MEPSSETGTAARLEECSMLIADLTKKAKEAEMNGDYIEAIRIFGKASQFFEKLNTISILLFKKVGTSFQRQFGNEYGNAIKSQRLLILSELYSRYGNFAEARKCLTKSLSLDSENGGEIYLRKLDFHERIKQSLQAENEIMAIQFLTETINRGKEILLYARGELKLELNSLVNLCEGLKLLIEGITENSRVEIEEAKQIFDGASTSIPKSYMAYKLFCDAGISMIDGDEGNAKNKVNQAHEVISTKYKSSYLDNLLIVYLIYLINKHIEKDEMTAQSMLRSQWGELDNHCNELLKNMLAKIGSRLYEDLPKVCPNCGELTSYIMLNRTEYECVFCSHRVVLRGQNEKNWWKV